MRLFFKNLKDSPRNLIQRAGYHFERITPTGEESYARRAGAGEFPKFHIYVQKQGEETILNLHFDQKKASYGGHAMHSGEYEDSEVLEREAEMLKKFLISNFQ
ncbi:MAG: hypothetical protein PHQ47_03850 [Candidatus Portnoybacteria bacterium]|nr:hypothetical protein [Candidatus Portnoybacteria bacterium]